MISRKITLACALTLLAACGSSDSRSGDNGGNGGSADQTGGKGGSKTGGSKAGGNGGSKATGGSGGSSSTTGGAGGNSATGGSTATGGSDASGGTGGSSATGGTNATGGSNATGGNAATGGTGGNPAAITMVKWDFEASIDPWRTVLGSVDTTTLPSPTESTTEKRGGTKSLAVPIDNAGGVETQLYYGIQAEPFVLMGAQKNIKKVTGYLWVPLDHKLTYTQMFTFSFGSQVKNEWQGALPTGGLIPGDWNKFEMDLTGKFPLGYPLDNLLAVGFQFISTAAWKTTLYIDDVTIELMP